MTYKPILYIQEKLVCLIDGGGGGGGGGGFLKIIWEIGWVFISGECLI